MIIYRHAAQTYLGFKARAQYVRTSQALTLENADAVVCLECYTPESTNLPVVSKEKGSIIPI